MTAKKVTKLKCTTKFIYIRQEAHRCEEVMNVYMEEVIISYESGVGQKEEVASSRLL